MREPTFFPFTKNTIVLGGILLWTTQVISLYTKTNTIYYSQSMCRPGLHKVDWLSLEYLSGKGGGAKVAASIFITTASFLRFHTIVYLEDRDLQVLKNNTSVTC